MGTMHSISDTPRKTCGTKSSQKSQSAVRRLMLQVPMPKPISPIISMNRMSILLDRMPAIGAVKNMHRPEMNSVSPIIMESKPRMRAR